MKSINKISYYLKFFHIFAIKIKVIRLPLERSKPYKHLPDVPTEKNIENNGIEINKILPILLQKIEENTLYIIELNKKIELLEEENNKLKNK